VEGSKQSQTERCRTRDPMVSWVVSLFLGDPVCLCRLLHRTPQLKQLHNWTAMTLARGPHGR
jgi:hypothetical protein